MGLLSRRKGADFERALVHVFADVFGQGRVRRGLQSRGGWPPNARFQPLPEAGAQRTL